MVGVARANSDDLDCGNLASRYQLRRDAVDVTFCRPGEVDKDASGRQRVRHRADDPRATRGERSASGHDQARRRGWKRRFTGWLKLFKLSWVVKN